MPKNLKHPVNLPEITEKNLIIVEGDDDAYLFEKLLEKLQITGVQLHSLRGDNRLLPKVLKVFKNRPNFDELENLGIILDANESKESKITSIKYHLQTNGYPVPQLMNKLSDEGSPHTCFLVIPPNHEKGNLEDLCLMSVKEDPAISCIDSLFECLSENIAKENYPKNISKAKVQVFMASRKESCPHLGIAAQKNYWIFDHHIFNDVKTFLNFLHQ